MFCENCGKELEDGARFCAHCGAKVMIPEIEKEEGTQRPESEADPEKENPIKGNIPEKKMRKFPLFIGLLLLCVVVIGGSVFGIFMINSKKKALTDTIVKSGIEEYMAKEEKLSAKWNKLLVIDILGRHKIVKELEELEQNIVEFDICSSKVNDLLEEKETYNLGGEGFPEYEAILSDCSKAVENKEAAKAFELMEDAERALTELKKADDNYIQEQLTFYEEVDLSIADKSIQSERDSYIKEIQKLLKEDTKDYKGIKDKLDKMQEVVFLYIKPENVLNFTVQQVDASLFPKIKLYVDISDANTGEVPKDLKQALFYINKKDANAKSIKQTVTAINQLNEKESLKVNMVADVSGSMIGSPLYEAESIMTEFVDNVQFTTGDLVELTSFADGVYLEQEFCSDANVLNEKIQSLVTGDMTSLYDALYTAVKRVAAQTGARCVIAFTDGQDNNSNCSANVVIDAAKRYHVPVFIIGIGSEDYSEVRYLAEQTGGAYYSVYDINSMKSIYDDIYRQEKELYLVEFEDNTGAKVEETASVEVGYHSLEYGGKCEYSYTPNILLNHDSNTLYADGPEAVVEKYLRNFAQAMSDSDFSLISDCIKAGSPLYEEQKKYVERDINEQLDSFEFLNTSYKSNNYCEVSTRETFYAQIVGKSLQLVTQECTYSLEKISGEWKMTAFVDLKVTSRIKQ